MDESEAEIDNLIENAIDKANDYTEKLSNFNRNIKIKIDKMEFHLKIENSNVERSKEEKPDIIISMNSETMKALISRELDPLEAYATRKVKVKAKIPDILYLSRML